MANKAVLVVGLLIAIGGGLAVQLYTGISGPPSAERSNPEGRFKGSFSLVNHNGKRVTEADFRGQLMLVYFGYTYCPDVCATEVAEMSRALNLMGKQQAKQVVPIFITVDPERDDPQRLEQFVSRFHPRLIGLTGTSEEIAAAARSYKVSYNKVEQEKGPYLMDHTPITYLMGPHGRNLALFGVNTPPKEMASQIQHYVETIS